MLKKKKVKIAVSFIKITKAFRERDIIASLVMIRFLGYK